jgi:radical SAM superfamily enzyme YgiQ (UPF0313 family)
MSKYRILLVNPRYRGKSTGLGAYRSSSIAPLALGYLAALTPDNYIIKIVDENIQPMDYSDFDIVGITSYTAQIQRAYEISSKFVSRGIPVVMGGIHVSMMPEEAIEYCTSVVIGEAEGVWKKLLVDFEYNCLKPKYIGHLVDLGSLPVPNRSHFETDKYLWDSFLTSKGCPMDCSFCSVTRFNGRKFRRRPVDQVINELSTLNKKLVWILDDNILGYDDKGWLTEFFNKIIERKINKYFFAQVSMKFGEDRELVRLTYKAGIRIVVVGIESVNIDCLRGFNKNLNANYAAQEQYLSKIKNIRLGGIAILGCFILGSDEDRLNSFHETLVFIKKAHIDVLQLSKPTPLPGTKFHSALEKDDRIINKKYPFAWKDYKFTRMLFKPKHLEIDDVYEGFHYVKRNYYSIIQTLRRIFFTLVDTKSISTTIVSMLYDHTYKKSWKDSEIYKDYNMMYLKEKFRSFKM